MFQWLLLLQRQVCLAPVPLPTAHAPSFLLPYHCSTAAPSGSQPFHCSRYPPLPPLQLKVLLWVPAPPCLPQPVNGTSSKMAVLLGTQVHRACGACSFSVSHLLPGQSFALRCRPPPSCYSVCCRSAASAALRSKSWKPASGVCRRLARPYFIGARGQMHKQPSFDPKWLYNLEAAGSHHDSVCAHLHLSMSRSLNAVCGGVCVSKTLS